MKIKSTYMRGSSKIYCANILLSRSLACYMRMKWDVKFALFIDHIRSSSNSQSWNRIKRSLESRLMQYDTSVFLFGHIIALCESLLMWGTWLFKKLSLVNEFLLFKHFMIWLQFTECFDKNGLTTFTSCFSILVNFLKD